MIARRVARYIRHRADPRRWSPVDGRTWCRLSVEPWWAAPADLRLAVQRAVDEPGQLTAHERRW
jgi:hypothetical protein